MSRALVKSAFEFNGLRHWQVRRTLRRFMSSTVKTPPAVVIGHGGPRQGGLRQSRASCRGIEIGQRLPEKGGLDGSLLAAQTFSMSKLVQGCRNVSLSETLLTALVKPKPNWSKGRPFRLALEGYRDNFGRSTG